MTRGAQSDLVGPIGPTSLARGDPHPAFWSGVGGMSDLASDGTTSWHEFLHDLTEAGAACVRTPWLIFLTAVLEVASDVSVTVTGPLTFLALVLIIINFAFYGTQRVWLLMAFNGKVIPARSVWSLTRQLIGRFVRLAWFGGLPLVGVFLGLRLLARGPWETIPGAAIALVADAMLTFVVPVLVFETDSVRVAWRTGTKMARQTWPSSIFYILTPGVALISLSHALASSNKSVWQASIGGLVAAEVALLFKGAILRYYLRLRPGTREVIA